jgi:hypothetical protein
MKYLIITLLISLTSLRAASVRLDLAAQSSVMSGSGVLSQGTSGVWNHTTANSFSSTIDGANVQIKLNGWLRGSIWGQGMPIFDDYRYSSTASTYVEFTGLDVNKAYDIVLYSGRKFYGQFNGGSFHVAKGYFAGDNTKVAATTRLDQFVENNNYVRFQGIQADSTGTIRFDLKGSSGNQFLNAVEIDSIPEPSGMMLSLAVLPLVLLFRRK